MKLSTNARLARSLRQFATVSGALIVGTGCGGTMAADEATGSTRQAVTAVDAGADAGLITISGKVLDSTGFGVLRSHRYALGQRADVSGDLPGRSLQFRRQARLVFSHRLGNARFAPARVRQLSSVHAERDQSQQHHDESDRDVHRFRY